MSRFPARAAESALPAPPGHVSLHIAGDRGLLLDARRQLLFAADTAATLLWCCLAEAMPRDAIVDELRHRGGLARRDAARFLDEVVAQWREAGLFDTAPTRAAGPMSPRRVAVQTPAAAVAGPTYRLLDTTFVLSCPNPALAAMARAPIRHLATADRARDPVVLSIVADEDGFALRRDGAETARGARPDEAGPLVLALMSWIAVHEAEAACAVHAGAVLDDGQLVLLPGRAGAGKSTLVAALAAAGCRALGDETVLLGGDPLGARALPGALSLKEGARTVLADALPALAALPAHRRPDGRIVRYLSGAPGPVGADDGPLPVRRIVFPGYDPDAGDGAVEILDTAAALAALAGHLFLLGRPLDAALVERLIAWIGAIPCYRLRYASLDDALRLYRRCRP